MDGATPRGEIRKTLEVGAGATCGLILLLIWLCIRVSICSKTYQQQLAVALRNIGARQDAYASSRFQ